MKILRKEGWRERKNIRKEFEAAEPLTQWHMQLQYQCNNEKDFLNCECCNFACGWKDDGSENGMIGQHQVHKEKSKQ